ncbi:hypothetical protein [Fictibacillus sp. NRS-1165]|uniref:hypothetical protein n=1 Tax=Fictibacillus sp. NRS-1165 TaxID=3144463 RepID=UPI003D23B47A
MSREQDYTEKPKNSSMTPNFKEMKEHGRVMEKMSTNDNVEKSGKTPDPAQYEHHKNKNHQ